MSNLTLYGPICPTGPLVDILLNLSELLQRKVVLFLFDVLRDRNQKDQCKSEYTVLRSFANTTA